MKVQLKCKTLGFPFGEILEVGDTYMKGDKKEKLSKGDLEDLVDANHAVEVDSKIASGAKELKAKLDEAEKTIAKLEKEKAKSKDSSSDENAEKLKEANDRIAELEAGDKTSELETAHARIKELEEKDGFEELKNAQERIEKLVDAISGIDTELNKTPLVESIEALKEIAKAK